MTSFSLKNYFRLYFILLSIVFGMSYVGFVVADTLSSPDILMQDTLSGTQLVDSGLISTGTEISFTGNIVSSTGSITPSLIVDTSTLSGVSIATLSTGSLTASGSSDILTSSGSSWATVAIAPIDYNDYSYYSGTFIQDGVTYGNSLYPNSFSLNPPKTVQKYSYNDYIGLILSQKTTKKVAQKSVLTQSAKTTTLSSMSVSTMSAPTSGLIAGYLFDGNANDTSINGYNGTPVGMNWENFGGRYAAKFTSNGKVSIPYTLLNNRSQITVNTWISWAEYNSGIRGILWNQGNYLGTLHYEYISTTGTNQKVLFYVNWTTLGSLATYVDLGNVDKNKFYMLTVTYDQINKTITYYLDWNFKWSNVLSSLPLINVNTDMDIWRVYDNTRYHSWYLDNFRIYNRILSASEIQDLYIQEAIPSCYDGIQNQNETSIDLGGICGPISRVGLVAEFPLNGNANDTSGNGNNGTPTNIVWSSSGTWDGRQVALFNGVNSLISNSPAVWLARANGEEITVNAWIKWAGGTGYQDIANVRGVGWHNWIFYKHTDADKLSFHAASNQYKWNYSIPQSQWIMVTATVNSWWVSQVFVNGILTNSVTWYTFGSSFTNTFSLWAWLPYSEYFSGAMSNVKIYNRVLNTSEISSLYSADSVITVSNNTTNAYFNSYISLNPTVTFTPNSFDQFIVQSNQVNMARDADSWKKETDSDNWWDPVNLATGEFVYDNTLMSIPGVGIPYELKIAYKNQTSYNGPLGFNWDHNHNQYLSGETNGNVLYANGQLGTFRFIKSGATWLRNEWLRATLVQSGWLYSINYDNGNISTFNTANRLSQTRDIHGNKLDFVYSGSYLSGVVDTLGRTISYTYYDHNRLRTVTDFTGRKVDFVYYTGATNSGNLYDLKDIILTNSGVIKTISFEYSTGSTEPQIHNITRLIDAKGQIYVDNTYDTGDRVTTQKYGNGTLTYSYTFSGSQITQNTVLNKLGIRTDYIYDGSGNNTSIRYYNAAQTGSVLYTYTYNTGGLIASETRPRGNGYKYIYDTSGNLVSKRLKADITLVDSAADLVTAYTYNSRNERLTETLPNNAQTAYIRDSEGNILTKTLFGIVDHYGNGLGQVTTNYTYYSGWLLKSSLSPLGRLTQYHYSSGQISKVVNFTGSVTSTGSFTYSPYGTVLTTTDGDGYTKTYTYTPFDLVSTGMTAQGIVTSYAYDANNNKIRETYYLTGNVANSYYYYDNLDQLTGSLIDITPGQSVLTSYVYDNNGNVVEKKVWTGAIVKYQYNEFSKVIEERILLVPGDISKDIVTSYTYDTNNNLVTKTDPRGYTTTYIYDLYDRVTQETDPQWVYKTYTYYKDNTVDTTSTYTSTWLILTRNKTTYDNYGHIVKSTNYLTPATSTNPREKKYLYNTDFDLNVEYDEIGTPTYYGYWFRSTMNNHNTIADALGNSTTENYNKRNLKSSTQFWPWSNTGITTDTYLYDADGRLTRSTNTLGKYKSYQYDNLGYIVQTIDEMGRVTDMTRDYRGLMTSSTSYSGATTITTTYNYDNRGNLVSIVDPLGRTTSYQYDGINRNTKVIYPDLKEVVFTYDKNSNLATRTDPNGTVVTNTYDSMNRLTGRSISRGSGVGGVTSETYTYDALGRLVTAGDNAYATLTGATYTGVAVNNLSFSYDALSRLMSESQTPIAGTWYTLGYTYSMTNDLTGITLPDGKIETYTYDVIHRPLVISYSGTTISTNVYTGVTQTRATYANGRVINYSYDSLNRVTSINHGATLTSPRYTYNDASEIISDHFRSYGYDSLSRIVSTTPSTGWILWESLSYDKSGNRSLYTLGTGSSTYTGNILDQYTNTTTGSTTTNSTYDDNGNLKTEWSRSYTYDYNNRLLQVNIWTGIIAQYTYDILGRRTKATFDGQTTVYIYNGDNIQTEYQAIWTGPLTTKKHYINGIWQDALIAYDVQTPSGSGYTSTMMYYHTDILGSVVAISTSAWAIGRMFTYDAFGRVYTYGYQSGVPRPFPLETFITTLYSNTRYYTWREYDLQRNVYSLYYHRARYYDPKIGRFMSRDPIGQNDQVNLYTYVRNSPLMYTDRDGKKASRLLAPVMNFTQDFIWHEAWYVWAWLYHLVDWVSFGYLDDYTGIQDSINSQNYPSSQHGTKPWFNRGWKAGSDASYLLDMAAWVYAGGQIATRYAAPKILSEWESFFNWVTYSDDVLRKSSKIDDIYHWFSPAVEKFSEKFWKVENFIWWDQGAYKMLKMPWWINNSDWVFEFIKDSSNQITHRFFRPN